MVARNPWITKVFASSLLEQWSHLVPQPIECLAQRCSPALTPISVVSAVATAILHPTSHPVRAAPGAFFMDLDFSRWRMFLSVFPIHGKPRKLVLFDVMKRVSQRHLSVTMMMSVGFAV